MWPLGTMPSLACAGTQGSKAVKLTRALAGPKAATAVVEVVEGEDLLAADTGGEPSVHPLLLCDGAPSTAGRWGNIYCCVMGHPLLLWGTRCCCVRAHPLLPWCNLYCWVMGLGTGYLWCVVGTSDPYVKGSLGPARFTTGVIFKTLFPKWVGERYELPVADWLNEESYMLRLKVRDYDTFSSDDDLGFCDIDLRPLRGGLTQNVWQDLQGVETGSIHVQITIKDDVGLSGESNGAPSLCPGVTGGEAPPRLCNSARTHEARAEGRHLQGCPGASPLLRLHESEAVAQGGYDQALESRCGESHQKGVARH